MSNGPATPRRACGRWQMADALAAAGTTTKAGKPLSPSSVTLQLERLGLVVR